MYLGKHLIPSRFFTISTHIPKYVHKFVSLSIGYQINTRCKRVRSRRYMTDRLQPINTSTAIVPCSGCSLHSSLLEKKFQCTPDTEAVFLPQRDLCLNPPQVTRSVVANLDISVEPFHQIFFQVQIISRKLFEIQRKLCIDKVSVKFLNKYCS